MLFKVVISNCCTNIIKIFNMIITYKHPAHYAFKKQKLKKHLTLIRKNIIILIYVFDNHNSAMMYDKNVTLESYKTMTHIGPTFIVVIFNAHTKTIIHVFFV